MFGLGRYPSHIHDNNNLLNFTLKWTPRAIVASLAGYYSLGFAYDKGLMTSIDRIAIRILRHFMGYVGIGGFMPTFQWYSAWGFRMFAAIGAGLLYDLAERIVCASYRIFFDRPTEDVVLLPASSDRSPPPAPAVNDHQFYRKGKFKPRMTEKKQEKDESDR